MDINNTKFPEAKEGDKVLWSDGKWYIFVDNKWVLQNNVTNE